MPSRKSTSSVARSRRSSSKSGTREKRSFDRILAVTFFGLVIFGVVMISSASAINSFFNTGGASTDIYFWNQLSSVVIALVAWFIVQRIPYRFWYKYRFFVVGGALLLLGTIFTPLRSDSGTFARAWIHLPVLPSIQPSELAKIGFVVYLAAFFDRIGVKVRDFKQGFIPFIIIVSIFIGLLILEPDFGSILLYGLISACMFFVANGNLAHLFATGAFGSVILLSIVSRRKYIVDRFTAFLNPEADLAGIGYQIQQALIAIGSGGLFGYGFGNSRQKFAYLPEAQSDTIFAVAAEELGFIRIVLVIVAFGIIAWRGMKVAENAPDRFSRYLATGIVCWISLEAFINIGVVMAILPNTGLTLPFISYGGSSLLTKTIAIAILLNISSYTRETSHYRRGQWGARPTFGRRRIKTQTTTRRRRRSTTKEPESLFGSIMARVATWNRKKDPKRKPRKRRFSSYTKR